MKKAVIALILAACAALAVHWYITNKAEDEAGGEMKLYGSVEMREVLLSFRVPGRVSRLAFEEGERVRRGEVVAEMDGDQYELAVREARAGLEAAEATLEKLRSGYEDDDIRAARAERERIAANLRNAETNYARFRELREQKVVAQKELDDATAGRDQLRAALAAADSTLHRLAGGFRPEDIRAAEAGAEAARTRLERAETSLADTRLSAPADGVILTRVAEVGTMVGAGTPVCAMQLARPIQIRAYVSERQLGIVRTGMKARVFIDSHPDDPIDASVSFISPEAEFTPKQVQTEDMRIDLVYRIRLLVQDDPEGRLKNGMPVTVMLEPDER